MDKITRTLSLYTRLLNGEKINKNNFCVEANCLARTFERDIQDIRLYLSDFHIAMELVYDRQNNIYYFNRALKGKA